MNGIEEAAKTEFSERLNEAFEMNGYPTYKRARFLRDSFNISHKAAAKWLKGESMPITTRIPELASLLNVTAEWLLMGIKEEPVVCSTLNSTCLEKVISIKDRLQSLSNTELTDEHYKILNGMLDGIDCTISSWLESSENKVLS